MKGITRYIHLFVISLIIFQTGLINTKVNAQPVILPDLAIVDDLVFSASRFVGLPVDVTVVIRNLGDGDAPASTVSLSWCCGTKTLPLRALIAGEYTEVTFEDLLLFQDSGSFSIEAQVDREEQIGESDESNNLRANDIGIILSSPRLTTAESEAWGGEDTQHGCPDVDLMKIGRVDDPYYVMEDSDGDGSMDRLKREKFSCYDDYFNPESSLYDPYADPCTVYKRGQKATACGTTSLAYTLQYFGINVTPDEVDAEIRFHFESINEGNMFSDPISLRDYAKFQGLKAEIYLDGTVENIKSFTDRGIPVLLNISVDAGNRSVFDGHWVVALSVCQDEQAYVGGIPTTTIVFYDPNGRQFGMTPSHLYDYWDSLYLWDQKLWTRLYIPITYSYLEPGNTDEIASRLVAARAIAQAGVGFQDVLEGSLFEGTVEMAGGTVAVLLTALGLGLEYGSDFPFVGGFFNATGEFIADLGYAISEITQGTADLLNWETWTDINKLGEALWDVIKGVGLLIYETLEYLINLVVDGIWGLLKDIGAWFAELGCLLFDTGCKQIVVHYKHNASRDPCMESMAFLNNYARYYQLGYLFTEPIPNTIPIYLYADPYQGDNNTMSETNRDYYLCNRSNWAEDDPKLIYLGLFGYSSEIDQGGYLNLSTELDHHKLKQPDRVDSIVCDPANAYGYILPIPGDDSNRLYVMNRLNLEPIRVQNWLENLPFSFDPCFNTETFFNQFAEGYTREMIIGKIMLSPIDGTIPLYRAFRGGVIDFMFYTTPEKILDGFDEQGIIGYIFAEQVAGTVPLYQFYYRGRDDHLLSLDPNAEGLAGYKEQEILGYIYPPDTEESSCCMADLYRFCKRREIEE